MRRLLRALAVALVAAVHACGPAPPVGEPLLRFGVIADVQYADKPAKGERRYRAALENLAVAVEALARDELAFVLQLGDLIDDRDTVAESAADLERVLALLEGQPHPLRHVVGNHCLSVPRAELLNRLGLERGHGSFVAAGFRFVVLDGMAASIAWPKDSPERAAGEARLAELEAAGAPCAFGWNGGLGAEQRAWLSAELARAEAAQERVVLLCHFPVLAEASHPALLLWDHAQVLEIVMSSRAVVAWINGHDHAGGYARHREVHFVGVAGMVEAPPEENAYAVVELHADRIDIQGVGRVPSRTLKIRRTLNSR